MPKHQFEQTHPYLSHVDTFLALLFERRDSIVWYADWKFLGGLCMWLATWGRWLIYGYNGNYYWKYLYTAGINLLVLHGIQYYGQKGLVAAMIALILQCGGTTYLWWKDSDTLKKGGFQAQSVYQDISKPILQVSTVFVGQMGLITFYLSSIFSTLHPDSISYVFWIASFFCLQMSAFFNRGEDSLLGSTWPTSAWADIIKQANVLEYSVASFDGKQKVLRVSRPDLVMRMIFGFIVNNGFRELLAFTVPILLCQFNDPLNFVVYCVGVNFIVTIDDMNPKHFKAQELGTEAPHPLVSYRSLGSTSFVNVDP